VAENTVKMLVPDIGGAGDVDVIEVLVKPGDHINIDDTILTLESEKASMDVPADKAGIVVDVLVKVGDKVSENDVILTLKVSGDQPIEKVLANKPAKAAAPAPVAAPLTEKKSESSKSAELVFEESFSDVGDLNAGPGVRRIAREFGIDLHQIKGTGEKGRITKEDVQEYVKARLKGAGSGGFSVLASPKIDFSKFGETETEALSKIKKISGANLHRNWVTIPHVTQFEEVDITEMEAFRAEQKEAAEKLGYKLTPLVFIMKTVVAALKEFPMFNASLDASGENLILKKYFHIGVAVDTPNGLVVPVIRDVDKKDLVDLARELGDISKKAREKGLGLADMQGGCFSISSLGGIGGTAFTPIINAPEVAILGVSRSQKKPVYLADGSLAPRLMMPLSLSYDHRVIDGAQAARFIVYLAKSLADIRTLLL
jgi:pyruvate dehydrogenase E2 component (dihydrolipoamide acetyltransferase)